MQDTPFVKMDYRWWLRFFPLAVAVLSIIAMFVYPLARIPIRLSRNRPIARQLAESLNAQFPGFEFRGAASYEREVIYIGAAVPLDDATRRDVTDWLRERKNEEKIVPEIWLRFPDGTEGDNTMIESIIR